MQPLVPMGWGVVMFECSAIWVRHPRPRYFQCFSIYPSLVYYMGSLKDPDSAGGKPVQPPKPVEAPQPPPVKTASGIPEWAAIVQRHDWVSLIVDTRRSAIYVAQSRPNSREDQRDILQLNLKPYWGYRAAAEYAGLDYDELTQSGSGCVFLQIRTISGKPIDLSKPDKLMAYIDLSRGSIDSSTQRKAASLLSECMNPNTIIGFIQGYLRVDSKKLQDFN